MTKSKRLRTVQQNRMYWKWLEIIVRHVGKLGWWFDSELFHKHYKKTILLSDEFKNPDYWEDGDRPKKKDITTTKLTTIGFNHYLFRIDEDAINKGLKIETPEERWYNELIKYEMEQNWKGRQAANDYTNNVHANSGL